VNIAKIHEKNGFKYAGTAGLGSIDHASWWTFDDEQAVRDRHWHIKPGEVVFDIGAAFGSYTLPALAMGARVVAFSPADFDTELLRINLDLNPELAKRCLIVRDGVHERDGWFDPDHSKFSAEKGGLGEPAKELYGAVGNGGHVSALIRVRSLDSFLSERPGIDRIDWIKMDIEGAELGALRGGEQCIRRFKPRLLIECHNFHVPDMEQQVDRFLRGLGLGYAGVVHPYHSVSHAYYEAR
jgi:FkbM family methyltransferase